MMKGMCWFALLVAKAIAQDTDPGQIVATGYSFQPAGGSLAPGQIIAFLLSAFRNLPERPNPAPGPPWPTEWLGVSVWLNDVTPLPILYVEGAGAGKRQYVTIQVPYELTIEQGNESSAPFLAFKQRGSEVARMHFRVAAQQARIVTSIDYVSIQIPRVLRYWLFPCIFHANGEYVNDQSRAKPGEELTLWAVGLGYDPALPRPKTGVAATENLPVSIGLELKFGKYPQPSRIKRKADGTLPSVGLIAAHLLTGYSGIYEVRFRLPDKLPPGTPGCSDLDTDSGIGGASVGNNAMVVIGNELNKGEFTFDGAAFCVEE